MIAEQPLGNIAGVDVDIAVLARALINTALNRCLTRKQNRIIPDHLPSGIWGHIHHGCGAFRIGPVEIARQHTTQCIEHQVEVRRTHPDFIRGDRIALGNDEVREHCTALLCQAGLVQIEQRFALHQRGVTQQRIDRHHPGAAKARNINGETIVDRRLIRRLRHRCNI